MNSSPNHAASIRQRLETETFSLAVDVLIRPAKEDDLDALEWFGEYSPDRAIILSAFKQQESGTGLMLLALLGDAPIAQVWIDFERHRSINAGFIWALRVFPWFRGLGVGERMLGAAENAIRSAGFACVELTVERDNLRARRFYERLGYRLTGEKRERYYCPDTLGIRREVSLQAFRFVKPLHVQTS
jgi:ribosomal protein S18 acetylase RimI-like enzyme